MKIAKVDTLLFRIGLIGCLVIAIVAVIPLAIQAGKSKEGQKKQQSENEEIEVSCWTPAAFTSQQNAFTEKTCTKYLKEKVLKKSDQQDGAQGGRKKGLFFYLISEVLLITIFYFIARLIHGRLVNHAETLEAAFKTLAKDKAGDQEGFLYASHVKKLSQGRILAIMYLLLHLIVAICWLCIGGAHRNVLFIPSFIKEGFNGDDGESENGNVTTTANPNKNGGEFECKFEMKNTGNAQTYEVNCQYTLPSAAAAAAAAAPQMALSGLTHAATVANTTLCIAMCIFGIIIIVNTFIIGPTAARESSEMIMKKYGVLAKDSKCFPLTDLSLVAMFKKQKIIATRSSEGTQLNDTELKNLEEDA